jgi:hypothetical protein
MDSMRTPIAAFLCSATLLSAFWTTGALGQTATTLDPVKAKAWLEQRFGIKSEKVVEATPDLLVALRSIEPQPPSNFHVIAHFEDFGPPDPLTPPARDQEYFINCPSRRFHVERIENFSEHGDRGAQSTSAGPSTWGRAIHNSPDERIILAVCGPVVAEGPVVAQASPQAVQPAPPAIRARTPPPVRTTTPVKKPAAPAAQTLAAKTAKPSDIRTTPLAQNAALPGVQLFAGQDRAAAQQFADALPRRLPAAAGVGRPEIVQASSNGRPIYRVQIAGFASMAAAAQFCSAAKAAGQDCFVPPEARP